MERQKYLPINSLWRIRQANGLELKQVAKLLDHRSSESIARYEKNESLPNLQTAIKLMLIYNSDLKQMFPDLFEKCRREIEDNLKKSLPFLSVRNRENLAEHINFCTYEEKFNYQNLSENDQSIIRKHLTKLAKKLAYL